MTGFAGLTIADTATRVAARAALTAVEVAELLDPEFTSRSRRRCGGGAAEVRPHPGRCDCSTRLTHPVYRWHSSPPRSGPRRTWCRPRRARTGGPARNNTLTSPDQL
ncbi:hypothetical protein GCM10028832_22800 [Streptomyces sparsus]